MDDWVAVANSFHALACLEIGSKTSRMDDWMRRVGAFSGRHALLAAGERVVVGLSGGVDSIVLASILPTLDVSLLAVHVQCGLRGAESDGDEAFVRAWCGERGIELVVRSFDTRAVAREHGASIQQAARALRYDAFEEVARAARIRKVVLGHHRDDQAETLLLNLLRGSGIEGLAGMPVRRPIRRGCPVEIVRPLLETRRREIVAYARSQGLSWREDTGNVDATYRRSALRSEILPSIQRRFGEAAVENLARAATLVREYLDADLKPTLRDCFDGALSLEGGHGVVDVAAVADESPVLRRRVLIEAMRRWLPGLEMDGRIVREVENLLDAQPGRRLEFAAGVVWRERSRLLIVPGRSLPLGSARESSSLSCSVSAPSSPVVQHLDVGEAIHLLGGTLRADRLPGPPRDVTAGAPHDVFLDGRVVRFPLHVRCWKAGDRFMPLGMRHSKKVSDFLTDERVPSHRKRFVHVVESGGRILWVLPLRIAEVGRVRSDSAETIRLRYVPSP